MSRTSEGLYYVEHAIRGQWSSGGRNTIIRQIADLDSQQHGGKTGVKIWTEQEPGSSGKESAEYTIRQLAGFVVAAERSTGDKATRAAPFAAQCEAGNVRVVRADWNREFVDELTLFPNGRHDDQVDAASLAFNKLAGQVVGSWYSDQSNGRGEGLSVTETAPRGVWK